jgi:hypothetical protein
MQLILGILLGMLILATGLIIKNLITEDINKINK